MLRIIRVSHWGDVSRCHFAKAPPIAHRSDADLVGDLTRRGKSIRRHQTVDLSRQVPLHCRHQQRMLLSSGGLPMLTERYAGRRAACEDISGNLAAGSHSRFDGAYWSMANWQQVGQEFKRFEMADRSRLSCRQPNKGRLRRIRNVRAAISMPSDGRKASDGHLRCVPRQHRSLLQRKIRNLSTSVFAYPQPG